MAAPSSARRWAEGAPILRGPWSQELTTMAVLGRRETRHQSELERGRDLGERFEIKRVERAGEVLGTEALGPVRRDMVVAEVHPAHARERRTQAIAGDHRVPDASAEFAQEQRVAGGLEGGPVLPAVKDHAGVLPVDPAEARGIEPGDFPAELAGERWAERLVHQRDALRQHLLQLGAPKTGRDRGEGEVAPPQDEGAAAPRVPP